MYTIALLAQRGGTGKTTLAINLAVAAEAVGRRTALVGLDPQARAAGWGDRRARGVPAFAHERARRARAPAGGQGRVLDPRALPLGPDAPGALAGDRREA